MKRTGWKLEKALEENCRNIFPERIKVECGVHGKHVPCVPLENSPKKVGALIEPDEPGGKFVFLGAQHLNVLYVKKVNLSFHPKTKVHCLWHSGSSRAQPWISL